jgi:hypothetical protein
MKYQNSSDFRTSRVFPGSARWFPDSNHKFVYGVIENIRATINEFFSSRSFRGFSPGDMGRLSESDIPV